ncbi:MAG: DUF3617 family protein [Pseudomonadota bacterium]
MKTILMMTLHAGALSALVATAGFAQAAESQSANLRPGQWSADMVMRFGGSQDFNETYQSCMGPREATMSLANMGREFAGASDCEIQTSQTVGNQVSFTMTCTGDFHSGSIVMNRLSDEAFTMNGDLKMPLENGQLLDVNMSVSAQYVGACRE